MEAKKKSKKSVWGLVYEILYLGSKELKMILVATLVLFVIAGLVYFSFDYGNLRYLKENLDEEKYAEIYENIGLMIKMLLCLGGVGTQAFGISEKYEIERFKNYKMVTPVSELRIVAIKYGVNLAWHLSSILMGIGILYAVGTIFKIPTTSTEVCMVVMAAAVINVVTIVATVLGHWLRSLEKGMLVLMIVIYAVMMCYMFGAVHSAPLNNSVQTGAGLIKIFVDTAFIYVVAADILVYPICFPLMLKLYQRREK